MFMRVTLAIAVYVGAGCDSAEAEARERAALVAKEVDAARERQLASVRDTPTNAPVDLVVSACRDATPIPADLRPRCAAAYEAKALELVGNNLFSEALEQIEAARALGAASPALTEARRVVFEKLRVPELNASLAVANKLLSQKDAGGALNALDAMRDSLVATEAVLGKNPKVTTLRAGFDSTTARASRLAAAQGAMAEKAAEAEARKNTVRLSGCENGDLVVPSINLWSVPGGLGAGASVIGSVRGGGVGGRCRGDEVEVLEHTVASGRQFVRVRGAGGSGWITDSFIP